MPFMASATVLDRRQRGAPHFLEWHSRLKYLEESIIYKIEHSPQDTNYI